MKYKIIEHTADVMFEVYGKSLNELFENSAIAVTDVVVERGSLKSVIKKEIKLENEKIDNLLFDFIEELIYLKDAEGLLFKRFSAAVSGNKLKAVCFGDKIDREKHDLKTDVKAITLHKFELKKLKSGYLARFILDL
ncbi:MAG TPA: archease [Candidatus Nanoarchaeia archaeon]|nr:archease [Candidatus Nanoarchaeia archaeon]